MTHPVDDILAPGRLLMLAIQHVLTMYAGAVTVPLVIAGSGVQTLGRSDLGNKKNLYVVALGLGVGLIPVADARFFDRFPPAVAGFLHKGVMLGIVAAVLLNLFLNRNPHAEILKATAAGAKP